MLCCGSRRRKQDKQLANANNRPTKKAPENAVGNHTSGEKTRDNRALPNSAIAQQPPHNAAQEATHNSNSQTKMNSVDPRFGSRRTQQQQQLAQQAADKSNHKRVVHPPPEGAVCSPHQSPARAASRKSRNRKEEPPPEIGVKDMEIMDNNTIMQTVEILKNPGQTLGFYIREGNGVDRDHGVFISRIAPGSVVENNGLLKIGDEIVTINSVDISKISLDDVVILMSIPKRLVLQIRTRKACGKNASCPSLAQVMRPVEEKPVFIKKGRSNSSSAVEMTERVPDNFAMTDPLFDPRLMSAKTASEFHINKQRQQYMPMMVHQPYPSASVAAIPYHLQPHSYTLQPRQRLNKSTRSLSPENYNSDSELFGGGVQHHRSMQHPLTSVPGLSHLIEVDKRPFNTSRVPDLGTESSEEINQWLQRFESLSRDMDRSHIADPGNTAVTGAMPGLSNRLDWSSGALAADDYWTMSMPGGAAAGGVGLGGRGIHSATSTLENRHRGGVNATQQQQAQRFVRKHSADSLMDYRTYQLEDPFPELEKSVNPFGTTGRVPTRNGSHTSLNQARTSTASSLHSTDCVISGNSRSRDLQLSRKPLALRTEDFRLFKPDTENQCLETHKAMDGLINVHILCGYGLKSSRTMLRDLYCVLEVDGVNKARTMIRTGAINFDWDEKFDVDIESGHKLGFLVYSWDPNTRHRLCFSGLLVLRALFQSNHQQKIALKLEPKGILYLDLNYHEPNKTLARVTNPKTAAIFGESLEAIIKRENSGSNIPHLVIKCVEEVELRGLEHVGIYRICGSAKRKQQLKEEFAKSVIETEVTQNAVSDINVVTGVLKDFLRELPEPIFSDALYKMLVDAITVKLPEDPSGSAKLMLSILECLPIVNQETLSYIMDHLKRVSLKSELNKMNAHCLAVCFGPVMLAPSPSAATEVKVGSEVKVDLDYKRHIDVLHYLLEIWPERKDVIGLPGLDDEKNKLVAEQTNTKGATASSKDKPTTNEAQCITPASSLASTSISLDSKCLAASQTAVAAKSHAASHVTAATTSSPSNSTAQNQSNAEDMEDLK